MCRNSTSSSIVAGEVGPELPQPIEARRFLSRQPRDDAGEIDGGTVVTPRLRVAPLGEVSRSTPAGKSSHSAQHKVFNCPRGFPVRYLLLFKQNSSLRLVRGNPVVPHLGAGDTNFARTKYGKVHHVDDEYGIRVVASAQLRQGATPLLSSEIEMLRSAPQSRQRAATRWPNRAYPSRSRTSPCALKNSSCHEAKGREKQYQHRLRPGSLRLPRVFDMLRLATVPHMTHSTATSDRTYAIPAASPAASNTSPAGLRARKSPPRTISAACSAVMSHFEGSLTRPCSYIRRHEHQSQYRLLLLRTSV